MSLPERRRNAESRSGGSGLKEMEAGVYPHSGLHDLPIAPPFQMEGHGQRCRLRKLLRLSTAQSDDFLVGSSAPGKTRLAKAHRDIRTQPIQRDLRPGLNRRCDTHPLINGAFGIEFRSHIRPSDHVDPPALTDQLVHKRTIGILSCPAHITTVSTSIYVSLSRASPKLTRNPSTAMRS